MATRRIILVSEMGGGWGHLLPLRALACEFIRRGADVVALAREAEKGREVFGRLGIDVYPTPAWTLRKSGFSLNYAQCLWGNGYWDKGRFQDHFSWWIKRLRALAPDFVLTDFSPTALLAAYAERLPRGAIGTGFTLPPPVIPMPDLHPWLKLRQEVLAAAEAVTLALFQDAVPAIQSIADLFAGASRFLTVFPEMDHFEGRPSERFWGPILEEAGDGELRWPAAQGPRVFLYLGAGNRCLAALLGHLRQLGLPVIGHIRGLSDPERLALETRSLKLSPVLFDLRQAARGADLAITQGGVHTAAAMLLSGVPLLLCPEQLEQALLAYRLNQRGLCEWLSPFSDPGGVTERFDRMVSAGKRAGRAATFAETHAGYDPAATAREVAQACLEAAA